MAFSTTGSLPTGLSAGVTYYVLASGLTGSTFEVSATPNGTAVNTSGSQSGTQTGQSYAAASGQTYTPFYGLPRYGDYPGSITNLSFTSQPSAALTNPSSFSIRWDGYLKPTSDGVYTFDVQASDGAKVYLDINQSGTFDSGETIIDASAPDSSATTPMTSAAVQPSGITLSGGQAYLFRVEYTQAGNTTVTPNALVNLRWNLNGGNMGAIPLANVFRADPLTGAVTTTTGLFAKYFNNSTLTDPPLYAAQDTSSSTITDNYGTGEPSKGSLGSGANNNWAGRFDTFLKAASGAGSYQFQLLAQSAGHLLLSFDGGMTYTEEIPFTAGTGTSPAITLTANQVVAARVEFYDYNSNGEAILSWKVPGATNYVTIPVASFYADAAGTQQPVTGAVTGSYWTDTAFIGYPFFADYQTQINYNKGSGEPGDSWPSTIAGFSASWDSYIAPPATGNYVFSLQAQTQARVYINGALAVDGWTVPGSAATAITSAAIPLTLGARVPIHVDFASGSTGAFIYLQWETPITSNTFVTMPNSVFFRNAATSQQGLLATYYQNTTQTPPFFYQVAENNNPELNYNYGAGSPAPGLASTSFTARWTGQVLPQYSEPYYFTVKSDDGARLWVNGQLVINKWQSQSTTENVSPPINLQAGVFYDIKVEYLQLTGNAEVHLNWYSADQAEQIIPTNRLFPYATGTSLLAGPPGVTSPASDTYVAGSGVPLQLHHHERQWRVHVFRDRPAGRTDVDRKRHQRHARDPWQLSVHGYRDERRRHEQPSREPAGSRHPRLRHARNLDRARRPECFGHPIAERIAHEHRQHAHQPGGRLCLRE